MRRGKPRLLRQAGFTYFGLMIVIMLIGIGLAVVGVVARTQVQREREQQLLFAGHQYRAAIMRFHAANGGRLPHALEQLLSSDTGVAAADGTASGSGGAGIVVQHFLRRLYPDPMTGQPDWQLLTVADGGIYGVASSSKAEPRKRAGFTDEDKGFDDAPCYRAWRFAFMPRTLPIPIVKPEDVCKDTE